MVAIGQPPGPSCRLTRIFQAAFGRQRGSFEASGPTTLTLPGILSNVANKEILQGYMEVDQTWREIAAIKSVNDFKQVTSYRMLDDMQYDELPPSVANGSYIPTGWKPRVDGYTTYDYSITWKGIPDLKLAFGIKNLTDKDPPFTAHNVDFSPGAGWDARVADPRGRAYTASVTYKF